MGMDDYHLAKSKLLESVNENNGSVGIIPRLRSVLCVFYNLRAVKGRWWIHGCGFLINGVIYEPSLQSSAWTVDTLNGTM